MSRRRAGATDRCQPIRDHLDRVDQEISDLRDSLDDPDIPKSIKKRIPMFLKQLLRLRVQLAAALKSCEALPASPVR